MSEKRLSQSVARMVSHHELQAARANKATILKRNYGVSNRIFMKLAENLTWRNFRSQNSTFDALARQKFIEIKRITGQILCRRLQELPNEVNCMNAF